MTESTPERSHQSSVDLHTHSTYSDGTLTPAELVAEAARRELRVLALTDHDTLEGLHEAADASRAAGIAFIPGVELSAEAGPHEVHLLGYFVDPDNQSLAHALADLAARRLTRNKRIVDRLNELGYAISFQRVLEIAGTGTVGRPHVARALVEKGYAGSISEAFDRLLAYGRPAFVPRSRMLPEDAVRMIRQAGAVPVLAHPLTAGDVDDILRRLVPVGLLGMEVFYGDYSPTEHEELATIASRWRLIPTGGSDYHGPGIREGSDLGSVPVPLASVERLREQWSALHAADRHPE